MGMLNRVVEAPKYLTEVNKGSVHMATYQAHLNERDAQGYDLHTAVMQDGNLITIFKRRT